MLKPVVNSQSMVKLDMNILTWVGTMTGLEMD